MKNESQFIQTGKLKEAVEKQKEEKDESFWDLESDPRDEQIVNNTELGISYKETIINLPPHKKELLGIDRIRRKQMLELPDDWYKNDEVRNFITEGRFPSDSTWNHTLCGDLYNTCKNPPDGYGYRMREKVMSVLEDFKEQDGFLQEISLEPIFKLRDFFAHRPMAIFDKSINKISSPNAKFTEDIKHAVREGAPWIFDMSVNSGESYERGSGWPVFVFGNKNKAFTKYIEAITSDSNTRQMMESIGWNFEEISRKVHSISSIKNLIRGVPTEDMDSHPLIPIVKYDKTPPLRWCHAELAIISHNNSENVLFFEKD